METCQISACITFGQSKSYQRVIPDTRGRGKSPPSEGRRYKVMWQELDIREEARFVAVFHISQGIGEKL